jgi:hypothetical protein
MPIGIELHNNGDVLALEAVGVVRADDIVAGLEELNALVNWPTKLLLDWTQFDKRGLDAEAVVKEQELLDRFEKIAIVLTRDHERRAQLLIERRAASAEVRRYEPSEREAAMEWLGD